jgi:hypothetical protein
MAMSDEVDVFVYLMESHADHKGRCAGDVLREWDEHGITQTIFDCYWGYHTEAIENAYEDIDCLTSTGQHAW